jgi:hypothetical protein
VDTLACAYRCAWHRLKQRTDEPRLRGMKSAGTYRNENVRAARSFLVFGAKASGVMLVEVMGADLQHVIEESVEP